MDLSRFSWRRLFRFRVPRGPGTIGGGEGGRECEGRDQGGPALTDAQRHHAAADAIAEADDLICGWRHESVPVAHLWRARDLYAFYGLYDRAEAVLVAIRQRATPPEAVAGPEPQGPDRPRSGSGVPANPNPGAVSPGLELQNTQGNTRNGGNSVW